VELKQIKELMAVMEKAGIKKLSIKEKTGFELQLERQEESAYAQPTLAPSYQEPRFPTHTHAPARTASVEEVENKEEKLEGRYIISPMVGTFYSSPSPDDPAFVKVGDRVDENTVVCIIEAMKVMNEVKAGMSGTVAEVCLEKAHPVEFGTKIFRIV
jgi:acetyl-CoA carboxylase biotin carboxyl carrier protein